MIAARPNTNSVWWHYSPQVRGRLTIDTVGSEFDTMLGVDTGSNLGALTMVAQNNNGANIAPNSRVEFNVTAGASYAILVSGNNGASGDIVLNLAFSPLVPGAATSTTLTGPAPALLGQSRILRATVTSGTGTPAGMVEFQRGTVLVGSAALNANGVATLSTSNLPLGTVQVVARYMGSATHTASVSAPVSVVTNPHPPPASDNFADRVAIPRPGTVRGTTFGATSEPGEPTDISNAQYPESLPNTIWWTYLATASGTVTIDSLGTNPNVQVVLNVYTGSALPNLTRVVHGVGNYPGDTWQARVQFQAVAGTRYQISAHRFWTFASDGDVQLNLAAQTGALAITTTLTAPSAGAVGQSLTLSASVAAAGGTQFATSVLNAQGVAVLTTTALPAGTHQITARYLGTTGFSASTSAARTVTITAAPAQFLGGGTVFDFSATCAPAWTQSQAVLIRYSPSELNGGPPSEVSVVWPTGAEHITLWGDMVPSEQFSGAAGRAMWTSFVFYPLRPLVRVVQR